MVKIVQNGHKVLRQVAKPVDISEIKNTKIQKIISDMKIALSTQNDGVAIAAPQIGVPLRIFVVSGKVFDDDFIRGEGLKNKIKPDFKDIVFINPNFIKISKDKKMMTEGCLSVRPLYGKVRRATKATVGAYNELGEFFEMEGGGLLAHIFQHETDHLDGILFIDKAKNIHEVISEEKNAEK